MIVNEQQAKLKNGKLRKVTEEFGHSYWSDDHGWLAGVTTILGDTLPTPLGLKLYWQNLDRHTAEINLERAKQHGSTVHNIIEELNYGKNVEMVDYPVTVRRDVSAYGEWVRTWQPDQMQSEQILFYVDDHQRFAGTTDVVFTIDGKRVLLDLKTSNIIGLSAYLQVVAYKKAYEQSYGEQIDELLILQLGTSHKRLNTKTPILGRPSNGTNWKIHHVDQELYNDESWSRIYDTWLMLNENKYPDPPLETKYPDTIQLFQIIENKLERLDGAA